MKLQAEVRQVKTMADMTVNVTFNIPEYHIDAAQQLLAMIGDMIELEIRIVGSKSDDRPDAGRARR